MNIEIERARRRHDQPANAGFLQRLALCDSQDVFVAIAMAAKLQPAVELPMVMQQCAGAICAHHQRAPGEVRRKCGAREAIAAAFEQLDHLLADRLLVSAFCEIERLKLGA